MKFKIFSMIGKSLENKGLVIAHGGNMSVREGEKIFITRHGAVMGELKRRDIVQIGLDGFWKEASMEHPTHQSIYKKTSARAIIHSHPPYTILLSTLTDKITPIDEEARIILGEVPVLKVEKKVCSEEVAEKAPLFLSNSKIVVVEAHGTFAIGDSLEEAFFNTLLLENTSRILILKRILEA
jgi:L-fuculose-phosphate aldolase